MKNWKDFLKSRLIILLSLSFIGIALFIIFHTIYPSKYDWLVTGGPVLMVFIIDSIIEYNRLCK